MSPGLKPPADPQLKTRVGCSVAKADRLSARELNLPIDLAPAVPEIANPGFSSNTTLAGGSDLLLQSFRFPKVALPKDFAAFVLHEATTQTKKKPSEMRFGGTAPEQLDVRGTEGLLFEKDGQITVYWQEDGVGHTATASLPRKELFRVIEDLL